MQAAQKHLSSKQMEERQEMQMGSCSFFLDASGSRQHEVSTSSKAAKTVIIPSNMVVQQHQKTPGRKQLYHPYVLGHAAGAN